MSRRKLSVAVETEILTRSARRCALCFGLSSDLDSKRGQIAHIDRDCTNDVTDNLVFLCLEHHDQHDSTTSQSKGFTLDEVKTYRNRLYRAVETGLGATVRLEAELLEARQQLLERDAAIRQHDAEVFTKADAILSETVLLRFLDRLQTDDAYDGSRIRAVDNFRAFFRETGNHYLIASIVAPVKTLLDRLDSITQFAGLNFFVYPRPQSVDTDWQYCLHPRLNVDREGNGNIDDMNQYDRLQEELDELCKGVRLAFKTYRLAIKVELLL